MPLRDSLRYRSKQTRTPHHTTSKRRQINLGFDDGLEHRMIVFVRPLRKRASFVRRSFITFLITTCLVSVGCRIPQACVGCESQAGEGLSRTNAVRTNVCSFASCTIISSGRAWLRCARSIASGLVIVTVFIGRTSFYKYRAYGSGSNETA